MSGRTCLVTGATGGIGRQTATRLAVLGAEVVLVARDAGRGAAAADGIRHRIPEANVEVLTADLADPAGVRTLAARVADRYDRLHVLVNNAGVLTTRPQPGPGGVDRMLATNHLGPFLLTNLLRDALVRAAPARVVTVASAAHRQIRAVPWDDLARGLPDGHPQGYPLTKLLNVLFSAELARRLAGTGVTANCLHPGFVRTDLGRDVTGVPGALVRAVLALRPGPAAGAVTPVYLASAPEIADVTGRYFVRRRPAEPSRLARDPQAAARLWALSERLCGLDPV
jgi:NAD(P)-dependent dehydrogenase (short-subunit alcohol dehydrogenase family)